LKSTVRTKSKNSADSALFVWLISHQPTVLFSQNKPAITNQPAVLFSHNKPAPAISHQPNEQAGDTVPELYSLAAKSAHPSVSTSTVRTKDE
jgi:hypothetical protein